MFAPSKTLARSVWIPAGPVTSARMPSGVLVARSARRASTFSFVSDASAVSIGTMPMAAWPSSLGMTAGAPRVAPSGRYGVTALASPPRVARSRREPSSVVNRTIAVEESLSGRRSRS